MNNEYNREEEVLFDFEKLEVYKKAEDFAGEVLAITDGFNEIKYKNIIYQIIRSSNSIFLNIAEGCSNYYKNDKKRYYRIARNSVFESVSGLRYMKKRGLIDVNRYRELYHECYNISRMLSGLIRSVDNRWTKVENKKSIKKSPHPTSESKRGLGRSTPH